MMETSPWLHGKSEETFPREMVADLEELSGNGSV